MTIPSPRFYLKDTKAIIPTTIYLQAKYSINEHQQRVMLTSADKVLPTEWDNVKQRVILSRRNLGSGEINLYLDKMEAAFKSAFRNLLIDDITPTQEAVKEKMEQILNLKPKIEIAKVTFYSFIDSFMNDCKINKKENTIKAYDATIKGIKEFGNISNKKFSFDDITMSWYTSFVKFLQSKGLCNSTVGKYIKNLKSILNAATELGHNTNVIFRNKSFAKTNENSHKIFLTKEEIEKMAALDYSEDAMKDIVRDYFIISTSTGLRYSDFVRIRKEHIVNNRIQMVTLKTNQEVVIPIATLVKNIFEKYNFEFPKCPCNQVFNRNIKEIGRDAELLNIESVTKTIGGKKSTLVFEKWELLSSHTGRRSFVSNAILSGINTSSIMLISGHKSMNVFNSYVKFNNHQNAENLAEHSFFN
jgi:site-specific recombinase XerD